MERNSCFEKGVFAVAMFINYPVNLFTLREGHIQEREGKRRKLRK
jgi:hypothetical protein